MEKKILNSMTQNVKNQKLTQMLYSCNEGFKNNGEIVLTNTM